jgi:hypothetical protein
MSKHFIKKIILFYKNAVKIIKTGSYRRIKIQYNKKQLSKLLKGCSVSKSNIKLK